MNSLPLLFLIISGTGAFSPSALLQSSQKCNKNGNSNRCTATHDHMHLPMILYSNDNVSSLRNRNLQIHHSPQPSCLYMSSKPPSTTAAAIATSTKERLFFQKKRMATFMAFMTGWADLLFIKKYNFFATMMTGNSMKMANAFVDGRITDSLFFLSIIISYIVGVGTFRRAELSYKDKAINGLFAPIVVACFICSDYLSWIGASKFIPGVLLSFAWGIINSVGSEVTGTLIFVVTGAMTRVANMIVDRMSRTAGRKKIPKEGFLMSMSVIGGFTMGAAWSAILSLKAPKLLSRGTFSIMGVIYGLLFLWLDRSELGKWWQKKNGKLCEISADETSCE